MSIKTFILNLRLKYSRKDSSFARRNVNYDDAKKIGVLIYNPDRELNNRINLFIKGMLHEGKSVEILCYTSKKNPIYYDFPCFYFSSKDIDWKGDFKREAINKFIKTDFDYLYSINILPFLPFSIILKKSRAMFRIGKFDEKTDLDMMIHISNEQNLNILLEQMVIYSKKIKSNE